MNLIEGIDWYRDLETDAFVWTAEYLAKRGFCCNGGCRHCPYEENGNLKSLEGDVCIYNSGESERSE